MKKREWGAVSCRLFVMLALLISISLASASLTIADDAVVGDAAGDAARGAQLYVGSLAMDNGGSPCIACHALTGFGSAGVANYGPDLSSLYADYGAEGVMGVLESIAFSDMEAIFSTRPLTETEQIDLTAFFAKRTGEEASPPASLVGPIILGVVIVFAIVALLGKRRLKGVRRPLIEQARRKQKEREQRGDA